jgi:hypothetical protein
MRVRGGLQVKVLFVTGFGPIVRDQKRSESLYLNTLALTLERDGDYLHSERLEGVKTFALWPLSQAAESCFGASNWPENVPTPQAWLEIDVEDVAEATGELQEQGYELLVKNRTEPWGQTVTRMISPEGLLLGITYTPSMRA